MYIQFYIVIFIQMWFWNKILTSAVSASMLVWTSGCSADSKIKSFPVESQIAKSLDSVKADTTDIPNLFELQTWAKKDISVCLETDGEDSFTYKKALESINDPENTTLEFPLSPLFKKYWNRAHPLAVRWIKKDFRALLWKNWIENLSAEIPQKLSHRSEEVTSDTQYEIWDTIRFQLINPLLKWVFPKYLPDQLKEEWFKCYSDSDSSVISRKIAEKQKVENNINQKKSDFIYDIVVKRLSDGKAALALYRDWELSMATYASVWLNSRKTKRWKFKTLGNNPYYYSHKYKSPMPYWVNFDEWWFWFHQWNVTWYPASHGCVRLPGLYAASLYSFIKWSKSWDVFIDNNLYIQKK